MIYTSQVLPYQNRSRRRAVSWRPHAAMIRCRSGPCTSPVRAQRTGMNTSLAFSFNSFQAGDHPSTSLVPRQYPASTTPQHHTSTPVSAPSTRTQHSFSFPDVLRHTPGPPSTQHHISTPVPCQYLSSTSSANTSLVPAWVYHASTQSIYFAPHQYPAPGPTPGPVFAVEYSAIQTIPAPLQQALGIQRRIPRHLPAGQYPAPPPVPGPPPYDS